MVFLAGKDGHASPPVTCELRENAPRAAVQDQFSSHANGQGPDGLPNSPQSDRSGFPPNVGERSKASERNSKFMESIRNLLRKSPMRFKDLYPIIAERHPEHCSAQGTKVSLAKMAWLNEIQSDLHEIAVYWDGWWHLKKTAAARYDREELYEKVWAEPIQKVAKYRVSDVALAKACRKRKIPLPGRGYWAKKTAGKPVPNPPPPPLG
jgi:hypothetical protein